MANELEQKHRAESNELLRNKRWSNKTSTKSAKSREMDELYRQTNLKNLESELCHVDTSSKPNKMRVSKVTTRHYRGVRQRSWENMQQSLGTQHEQKQEFDLESLTKQRDKNTLAYDKAALA
ncbi:hypothetical protein MKW94_018618 [Papaver nudicaule]|uniref:Uncharacterized protein n=1 Tax=Papaver nudicaule TaxID=74823 RepID=A0AA41VXT0_PAPNU|nr:hypothetical protein [Papaver nudicaule]